MCIEKADCGVVIRTVIGEKRIMGGGLTNPQKSPPTSWWAMLTKHSWDTNW
ncbi:protein of unknown function [Vibrio tapetis subsp. tapetis]|uniref:Uncharacterized protein n=1 Tax=Vibrio tapetis subsp. tapetis TaxID=1671868 RepID=A0A2N8ZCF8_9VIBR|nr:protein of unknown function [Vibrio tapetis subsp. tapetis]